jgi:hypothetical protein
LDPYIFHGHYNFFTNEENAENIRHETKRLCKDSGWILKETSKFKCNNIIINSHYVWPRNQNDSWILNCVLRIRTHVSRDQTQNHLVMFPMELIETEDLYCIVQNTESEQSVTGNCIMHDEIPNTSKSCNHITLMYIIIRSCESTQIMVCRWSRAWIDTANHQHNAINGQTTLGQQWMFWNTFSVWVEHTTNHRKSIMFGKEKNLWLSSKKRQSSVGIYIYIYIYVY